MAGLAEVIGLLYRADWTRLSLSAEVRFEQDGDLARRRENAVRTESMRRMGFRPGSPGMPDVEQEPDAERDVYHRWHAALLIAPGRRYRLEYEGDHGGRADGSDGEQAWTLRPPDPAPLPPRGFEVVSGLPVPALFRPAGLLVGFTLDMGGPVTACGREAIAVTAVPRHGAVGSGTSLGPRACDRVELIVDAETGILLRREETFEGQVLTLTELTTVTMTPPEADDPARFAPPAGSRPAGMTRRRSRAERARLGGGGERRQPGGGRSRSLGPAGTAPARPPPGRRGQLHGRDAVSRTGPARSRRRATALRRPARPALPQRPVRR